ncbi:hypothetical protein FHT28_005861 [Rhizobium sp. SG570]|nr:hypothetical protein [Rhizobium sp. SG570]
MKAAFIALGLAAATIIGPITPALAQVVIHQDQSSTTIPPRMTRSRISFMPERTITMRVTGGESAAATSVRTM